jgi:hypothetical protein
MAGDTTIKAPNIADPTLIFPMMPTTLVAFGILLTICCITRLR